MEVDSQSHDDRLQKLLGAFVLAVADRPQAESAPDRDPGERAEPMPLDA